MGDAQSWLSAQAETIRERLAAGAVVFVLRRLRSIGLTSCTIQVEIRGREVDVSVRDVRAGHAAVPQMPDGVE